MLNPRIVGAWDGTHIWLQWDALGGPSQTGGVSYEARLRFSESGVDWGEWQSSIKPPRAWFSYNAQNRTPGIYVQADVNDGLGAQWERALGAKFIRSVCRFAISSERRRLHFIEGTAFHSVVDGAACSYKLTEEIEVEPGQTLELDMVALASGPWAQIDNAGDFLLRPGLGVRVTNLEPSRNDLELTGVDFSQITAAKRDGPIALVALPRPT
jgi:hypothetical protein